MDEKENTPKHRRGPPAPSLPEGELRFFFLAKQGFVQRIVGDILGDGVDRKYWPIAHTHEDANRLVDFLGLREHGVRPAEIGTADGETVTGHFRLAHEEGCEFVVTFRGWTEDGKPLATRMRLADVYPGPEGGP